MSGGMTISAAEATWGMIILFIVLTIVVFFFCCVPTYKALQERYSHWDDPENDPRWNVDQFQFSPTSPRLQTKSAVGSGYNRLSVCSNQTVSRGSSFKNTCVLPRMEDQFEVKLPPAYTDICSGSGEISSLGTPPAYTSEPEESTDKSDSDNNKPAPQQNNSKTTTTLKAALLNKQAAKQKAATEAAAKPATQPAATPKAAASVTKTKAAALKSAKKPAETPAAATPSSAASKTAVVTAECEKPGAQAQQTTAAPPARKTYKKIKKNKQPEAST